MFVKIFFSQYCLRGFTSEGAAFEEISQVTVFSTFRGE